MTAHPATAGPRQDPGSKQTGAGLGPAVYSLQLSTPNLQSPISNIQCPIPSLRSPIRRTLALLCLCFAVSLATNASTLINVPTHSWVYESVDYLKTIGLIRSVPSTSRPWSRGYAARLVSEALADEHGTLTGAAAYHLQRLVVEFADEIRPEPSVAGFPAYGPLFRIPVDSQRSVAIDVFDRVRVDTSNPNASIGLTLNTTGDERFAAYNRMEFIVFRDSLLNAGDSSWIGHVPSYREYRGRRGVIFTTSEAYLKFKIPWLDLELGRDYSFWGPGYLSSVMLSDNAPSLDQIRLVAEFERVKLTAFTAALSPFRDWQRFVSGQRFEMSFGNRLVAGLAMFVVHCPDSAQTKDFFGYINPLIPLYPEIADAGHDDNVLAGCDVALYLPRVKLYGQLMLDNYEFSPAIRKNTIRPPDAFAFQLGLLANPIPQVALRYEYARVNNYTYYHPIRQIAFTTYDVPLGHSLGPDADQHYAELDWFASRLGYVSIVGDLTRRGDHNRGDQTNRSYHWGLPQDPRFPTGVVEQTVDFGPRVTLNPLSWLKLTAQAAWYWTTDADGKLGATRSGPSFGVSLEHRVH